MIYQAFQLSQDKKQIRLLSATCGLPISAINGEEHPVNCKSTQTHHNTLTAHNTWLTHPVGKEQAPKAMRCKAMPCARRDSAALPDPAGLHHIAAVTQGSSAFCKLTQSLHNLC